MVTYCFLMHKRDITTKYIGPYIGSVVKTNENIIRCIDESIVITESNNMYTWLIASIVCMEPKWSPSQIKIIFADGLITQNLLESLSISDTCVLRGDFYHHMHEVFPKSHNFGQKQFDLIKKHFRNKKVSVT